MSFLARRPQLASGAATEGRFGSWIASAWGPQEDVGRGVLFQELPEILFRYA